MLNRITRTTVGILALFVLANNGVASEQDTPLTATVSVSSIFKISLNTTAIDFGTVDPGSVSKRKNIEMRCLTNNNRPWTVSMRSHAPLSYGEYEIPNSNFKWELKTQKGTGTSAGSGTIETSPVNIYTAGMDDYITEEHVKLKLSLYVDVPEGQVAGQYRTIITLSMYEE